MDEVYVSWQDSDSRFWHIIGRLKKTDAGYQFNYTNGAKKSEKFQPFSGMEDLYSEYISNHLFPFFANRVLSAKRPEYTEFIQWLGLNPASATPFDILMRSEGSRSTDNYQVIKKFEWNESGEFKHSFFSHGLSHLNRKNIDFINELNTNEILYLCMDCQNQYDNSAILIRSEDPKELVGYIPRFLSGAVHAILEGKNNILKTTVKNVFPEAPLTYRLRCQIEGFLSHDTRNQLKDYLNEFQKIENPSHEKNKIPTNSLK